MKNFLNIKHYMTYKKMRYTFIFFFLLFSNLTSNACDCIRISDYEHYKTSDVVLLGQIISVDENNTIVSIIESFKGGSPDSVLKLKNHTCTFAMKKGEQWLLYLTSYDGEYEANACGNSKKDISKDLFTPFPLDSSVNDNDKIWNEIRCNRQIINYQNQLTNLRYWKRLQKSSNNEQSIKSDETTVYQNYIIIILLLILLFSIWKKGR